MGLLYLIPRYFATRGLSPVGAKKLRQEAFAAPCTSPLEERAAPCRPQTMIFPGKGLLTALAKPCRMPRCCRTPTEFPDREEEPKKKGGAAPLSKGAAPPFFLLKAPAVREIGRQRPVPTARQAPARRYPVETSGCGAPHRSPSPDLPRPRRQTWRGRFP